MNNQEIIKWLLKGDVSIQYQVYRDLLGQDRNDLQKRITTEGWGKRFLEKRNKNGHWGLQFYQPKWTSTHYTLLDLRNLNLDPDNTLVKQTIDDVLETNKAEDGGIQLGPSTEVHGDTCVNGMFLNYASYFKTDEKKLQPLVDCILSEIMPDGGFNCRKIRNGATHSSLHTTISVLEGLNEFKIAGNNYRKADIEIAIKNAEEFILIHQLFISDRTGEIINKDFLKLTYPYRWRYDILRAMDYFQYANTSWDDRMQAAIDAIQKSRNKEGSWNNRAKLPGKVHFEMEKAGKPGCWNTLRAMRVLKHFKIS